MSSLRGRVQERGSHNGKNEMRDSVDMALGGVTDGASELQTEHSEMGEEGMSLLQTPAPRRDCGTMPGPASLGSDAKLEFERCGKIKQPVFQGLNKKNYFFFLFFCI